MKTVLTIAGSDSGGGAGIQADLRTFASLGVSGTSAITAITAQNPAEVRGIFPVDPDMVALQIRTVCRGFRVAAAKTGMLYSAGIVHAVAKSISECRMGKLVVDPVMISTSGTRLLKKDALETVCRELFPRAAVITPNVPEAEILCGHGIASLDEMRAAAQEIGRKYGTACVIKGRHLGEAAFAQKLRRAKDVRPSAELRRTSRGRREVADVLYHRGRIVEFRSLRLNVGKTHGTGCVLSAALAAFLAQGERLELAVGQARRFVLSLLSKGVLS